MSLTRYSPPALVLFCCLLLLAPLSLSCRRQGTPAAGATETSLQVEPERYAAVVEQRVEDGEGERLVVTRLARDRYRRREEWSEAGERFALILRYDLDKSFLLNLDRQLYVESDLGTATMPERGSAAPARRPADPAGLTDVAELAESLTEEEPERVETNVLPDEQVDDHRCVVTERRASFAGGRGETVRTWRAMSLGGLVIRSATETVAPGYRGRSTVTRRQVRLEVEAEEFIIPAGFKKVSSLSRR